MSAATATTSGRSDTTLELYRDDGPLARAIGASLGPLVPLPPTVLIAAGAAPLLAVLAFEGAGASELAVGAAIGWLVLAAGASSGRPHADRLRWAVPPVVRVFEYATVLWLAALAGGSAPAAAFALLAAVAFRHYDLVYRMRYQGDPPPRWVGDLGGGWEGRLVVGYLLLLAGAVPAGFFALAGLLGGLFVAESAASWARLRRFRATVGYEDEEAEEE